MQTLDLQPPPQLLASLSDKQREAVNHLIRGGGNGIAWWKVGEGKTRIALAWMHYIDPDPKPLIICSPGAFRQWDDEIQLLGLDLKVKYLSYGMLSRPKGKLALPLENYNCLVIDELWMYKNYKSIRSKLLRRDIVSFGMPAIGLSGSMVTARNIEDLYGQARVLLLDPKISPNISAFRRDYEVEFLNYAGFIERTPRKGAVEKIQTKIAKHIHVYFPKERLEIRNVDVGVSPSPSQLKIRRDLVKNYYYEHQEQGVFKLEVKGAASLLIKLQQVSDGFLRDNEGNYLPIVSSKMLRLAELCADMHNAGERMLIWVAFRKTAELLSKALPYPTILLSSEHPFNAKGWKDKKANICIATVGSGSSLNDFADVRYAIFYSTRFSHVQVQQAKGRTNRKSSSGARYYYYLTTDGFPDDDILTMVEDSRATEEMIIIATNKIIANTMLKNEGVSN